MNRFQQPNTTNARSEGKVSKVSLEHAGKLLFFIASYTSLGYLTDRTRKSLLRLGSGDIHLQQRAHDQWAELKHECTRDGREDDPRIFLTFPNQQ